MPSSLRQLPGITLKYAVQFVHDAIAWKSNWHYFPSDQYFDLTAVASQQPWSLEGNEKHVHI